MGVHPAAGDQQRPAHRAGAGRGGHVELSGLPDNAAGLAQAIVRLRDRYAPNVVLGYHLSTWATGNDFICRPERQRRRRPRRHLRPLLPGARCEVRRGLHRHRRPRRRVHAGPVGQPGLVVHKRTTTAAATLHQGVRADRRDPGGPVAAALRQHEDAGGQQHTWNHYQDNKGQWLLDDPTAGLTAYADAGVIAFMFGRGADGVTLCLRRQQRRPPTRPPSTATPGPRSAPTTTAGSSGSGRTATTATARLLLR